MAGIRTREGRGFVSAKAKAPSPERDPAVDRNPVSPDAV